VVVLIASLYIALSLEVLGIEDVYLSSSSTSVKTNKIWSIPINGQLVQNKNKHNKGVTIKVNRDYYVKSARSGIVRFSGVFSLGYMYLIIVEHIDGYLSIYRFSKGKLLVKKNDKVLRHQKIHKLDKNEPDQTVYFEISNKTGLITDVRKFYVSRIKQISR